MVDIDLNTNIKTNISRLKNILGNDYVLVKKIDNIIEFEFVNKSKILNKDKDKYIKNKIKMLKQECFFEVSDKKIKGVGRFLEIEIKSIKDYQNDKIVLLERYKQDIQRIDDKIEKLSTI